MEKKNTFLCQAQGPEKGCVRNKQYELVVKFYSFRAILQHVVDHVEVLIGGRSILVES